MGNVVSSAPTRGRAAEHVTSESETMDDPSSSRNQHDNGNVDEEDLESASDEARAKCKEDEMNEFRKQLSIKREQRKQILAKHRSEKEELLKTVERERQAKMELHQTNQLLRELLIKNNIQIPDDLQPSSETLDLMNTIAQMKEEFENLRTSNNKLRKQLAESNTTLQNANTDIADLTEQNTESIKQIKALKEVVSVSKTMIALREQQLAELKNKLSEIEKSLTDREASMLSTDLRQEYERQLQNIRTLRSLYEERARLAEVTRQNLVRELEEQKLLYQAEVNKSKTLSDKVKELEDKIDALVETVQNKNNQISMCQDESAGLKAEMTVVNKLFSEVLLGYKTKKDLDKLANRLEENHGILTQMAERENDSEALTALPKLLLELVNQVDEGEENKQNEVSKDEKDDSTPPRETTEEDAEKVASTTAEEIVQNLPKVWRVLMELLSHQNVADENTEEKVSTCYKSVETKSGPVLVPSVSQTYIRLKDLIIEKLTLIKEVNRMKQLNTHLETRLEEQERKLCLVTTELSKTWHVVGRLRRHHHQLHTHEKILKYELQQKRKLLNELKEELECCREKWDQAREKNTQSEKDWRKLRAEFSSRKTKSGSPSFNNSGESGYSDERPSDESSESNDESEYVTEPPLRCKKKLKKSFETILDSSTDFNLAAEREDPASDMLDVADLPLDTQDDTHSESMQKSEVLCEETEDEIGEITNDTCLEDNLPTNDGGESSTERQSIAKGETDTSTESDPKTVQKFIDPTEILKNIKQQNERLAKKDQKLESLEKSSANLLTKVKITNQISDQISSTLDHILKQPKSNREIESTGNSNISNTTETVSLNSNANNSEMEKPNECIHDIASTSSDTSVSSSLADQDPKVDTIDFKAILENVKKQNERLAKKDKKFEELENECSTVISNLNGTLRTGENLSEKLEILHSTRAQSNDSENPPGNNSATSATTDEPEASTSNDIDHEARFAARDLRLKRLEEQTKSLVNKVNKTTSKGVKIHYKLEELHNIYGSESSRAGTPSEDTEEKSIEEETHDE